MSKKLDENYKFARFLKNHAEEEEFDKRIKELHNKYFKIYDCSKCLNCCKKLNVSFTNKEIEAGSKELKCTVEELKNLIETSLQMQYKQQFEAAKENAVLGKLIGECEVEVSDEDVEKALQQHIQHISIELAQQGLQLEQYLQMMNTDFRNLPLFL